MSADLSVVAPVYNEGNNIGRLLEEIETKLAPAVHEVLLVYDFEEDDTLPAAREAAGRHSYSLRLIRNASGHFVERSR